MAVAASMSGPLRAEMVKAGAYLRDGRTLYRIEAKREIGHRVEVLVENCRDRNEHGDYRRKWVPLTTVLSWVFVSDAPGP